MAHSENGRADQATASGPEIIYVFHLQRNTGKLRCAAAAAAPETPAAEPKKRKASDAAQRRGRPPLTPEVYVEFGTSQYNITDVVERAKADYRTTHKVGVQSCKVYVKPEEGAAYYVINKVSGKLEL